MIIKGHSKYSYKWFCLFLPLPLPLLLLLVLVFLKFYQTEKPSDKEFIGSDVIRCGAEKVKGDFFIDSGIEFYGSRTQSDEQAFSGQYSSKLNEEQNYGWRYSLANPTVGKRYKFSAWSFNPHPVAAYLVVSANDSTIFYKETSQTVERNGNYWEKRELKFTVPAYNNLKHIDFYIRKDDGPNSIYFDEFEIREIPSSIPVDQSSFVPKHFELVLDIEAKDYLDEMKTKSIAKGLIFNDGSKTRAKINDDDRSKKIKIRLKGDWLDHVSKHPSYRVDMDSDESWNGMQSFSLQEPRTRGYLREWVFFKFLDYADVLHPRHDFILFKNNNDKALVFSYEEHFTKNLVESNKRREGPILKLTEERMWQATQRKMDLFSGALTGVDEKDKSYWSSEIRAFKEGKFKDNPGLKDQFKVAQNLMHQYKYNLKSPGEIFDLDRLAKYLSLVDICLAKHAITWHNQRFYYNPVTSQLEPIGFDAYSSEDPNKYANNIHAIEVYHAEGIPHEPLEQLLYDDEFAEIYFKYLDKYSKPDFVQELLESLEKSISEREQFLNTRFPQFIYDRKEILQKAKQIQIAIPAFVGSLVAYNSENNMLKIKLINNHDFPLKVYLSQNKAETIILYPQKDKSVPQFTEVELQEGLKNLQFEVLGLDSIYTTSIHDWPFPQDEATRQKFGSGNLKEFTNILAYDESNVVFNLGRHTIDKPLFIPAGKRVLIKAGTQIEFVKDGFIISYSGVNIMGDQDDPVRIKSIDGQKGSFTVLQASEPSLIRHTFFENQNTLAEDKWNLTGAVNFYESDVTFLHTSFGNSKCEDALNIIRANFELESCYFYNTFGDAFDADFCTGDIKNCIYKNCGNDAIDVSGSQINIVGTTIDITGDKGVSAGEHSNVKVEYTRIKDAPIGLASKDLSELTIKHVTITDCKTGIAAFQKKPEFGPAVIYLYEHSMENIKHKYMIEPNSKVFDLNQ